jgi:hypothetical protein
MNVAALFQELEQQSIQSGATGTLERRIPTRSTCDLFVGVQKPGNTRSFRVRFASKAAQHPGQMPQFRGLELREQSSIEAGREYFSLVLKAATPTFGSVFGSLAEDVARHVSQIDDEEEAAVAFFGRLLQWQRLLERQGAEGLTSEEQRGLYGELWFLREHVLTVIPQPSALSAWTGPERTSKDFQFPGCAVEVKTTSARQHQYLQITSEKQLDDTGLNGLFLCHLSLDIAQGTGETLPQIVAALRRSIANSSAAVQILEDRLLEVGYLGIHESTYEAAGYLLRDVHLYRVRSGFPRIMERDLLPGVGDVRYSISAAECRHYAVSAQEMHASIKGMG